MMARKHTESLSIKVRYVALLVIVTMASLVGHSVNAEKMDFKLWEWDGEVERPTLRETEIFERRLKPEGITRVSNGAEDFTFIVFDVSGYVATD